MPKPRTRTLDHQYLIRVAPDRVFRAIIEPTELTRWLCDHAEIEPRKGGAYSLGWSHGPTHRGTIVDFEAGRRIAFAWSWPGVDLEGTILSLSVDPAEGGTELKVQHSGFPRSERWVDLFAGAEWGWTYFAMNLKSVLETGRDLRAPLDG